MSTDVKWMDAAELDGLPRNADCLDDDQYDALRSQARAALSLRDELAALRVESQEGAEIVGELKAELAEAKTALDEMIRLKELHISGGRFDAALVGDAVHIMAALMVQWFRDAGGPNYCGVGMKDATTGEAFEMTLQRVEGDSPQVVAGKLRDELASVRAELEQLGGDFGIRMNQIALMRDEALRYYNADGSFVVMESPEAVVAARKAAAAELAECRAKLAAQIERCGFAELAETQRALERDNALAKLAQAESETARVRAMLDEDEALRDAVRENLPECTCDADGNLGGEVDRVEFAGEELRRALAKLAQAEQERNRYAAQTVTLGVAHQMAETDLAAAQAENAELRNVVAASEAEWRKLSGPASAWSDGDARRDAAKDIADDHARVLARPADVAALRVMLLEWAGGVWALAAPDREMDANTITAELDRRLRGGK